MDYSYLIIPLIVLIGSQAIKLATDGIKGNFDLRSFFITYGGMPSSHTAFVTSITTLIGLRLDFDSAMFALALVFTLLIMRDAVSFRNFLGKQGKMFNLLSKKISTNGINDFPQFYERLGHSPLEVLAGAVWGIAITYLLNLI